MIIKATFTGEDRSAGYVKGFEYELKIYAHNVIKRVDQSHGSGRTPYESLGAFLANWNNITVIKK